MNPLIKELASKALKQPDTDNDGLTVFDNDELEKFAELIVRECADICMEMATKCAGLPGDGALAKDCADWIKKDFGVEE
jgi:hypothetical protein